MEWNADKRNRSIGGCCGKWQRKLVDWTLRHSAVAVSSHNESTFTTDHDWLTSISQARRKKWGGNVDSDRQKNSNDIIGDENKREKSSWERMDRKQTEIKKRKKW